MFWNTRVKPASIKDKLESLQHRNANSVEIERRSAVMVGIQLKELGKQDHQTSGHVLYETEFRRTGTDCWIWVIVKFCIVFRYDNFHTLNLFLLETTFRSC